MTNFVNLWLINLEVDRLYIWEHDLSKKRSQVSVRTYFSQIIQADYSICYWKVS